MKDRLLQELIFKHCKHDGDKIAVVDYNRTITYAELDKISEIYANVFTEEGIIAGTPVVVVADRCLELIAIALAILKCGAIYVPVDLNYPLHRVEKIISNTGSKIVVNLSDYQLTECNRRIITLQELRSYKRDINKKSDINRKRDRVSAAHIAYIIYTSGTTGNPKGVMVSHKAIINTLRWMTEQFEISGQDVIAHKTSISFTDSIWEIFWPLVNGATISILNSKDVKDPKKMFEWLLQQRITYTQFVPSMLKVFVEYAEVNKLGDSLKDLKWVFNGGEQVGVNLVRRFYDSFKSTKYANIYGMTESAIYATFQIVERESLEMWNSIPIGKPIRNTTVRILNERNQVCEPYQKGEICISGVSLADGYWNDERLTREKFISYKESKGRLYRTGDLGMTDENGRLWYFGRKDNQVNVYGNRVEIYEVEKNILEYEGVTLTAVIPYLDQYGETYLVCYLENEQIDVTKLKAFLKRRIPEYMIPKIFQKVKALPLSVNKKVDKTQLKNCIRDREVEKKHKPETNSVLRIIREIWGLVLEGDNFGNEEEFLQVGGDSLTLARVQIELEKHGLYLSYEELLEHKTINQIVSLLKRRDSIG